MNESATGTSQRVVASQTATGHATDTYLPLPKNQRSGIALCLSGGGFRASVFHLGALRRLNELGVLGQVDTITSVSGGTIFAAQLASHLATRDTPWPPNGGRVTSWEEGVAVPVRALARTNVRTGAILSRLKPRNWLNRSAPLDALSSRYADGISRLELRDLPDRPRFVFLASDMQFGEQWVFDTGLRRVGSRAAGYLDPPLNDWKLARAVVASACVPGVFAPLRVKNDPYSFTEGTYQKPDRARRMRRIDLTDGGVYDNLGLEPAWRDHETILVSDGAPTYATLRIAELIWQRLRHFVLLLDQATAVRKRWLISNYLHDEYDGAYWSVGSLPSHYGLPTGSPQYSDRLVDEYISSIRIDLDAFTVGEVAVLENHGYLMAEAAIKRHAAHLVLDDAPPLRVPHPDWMDEERAASALRRSHKVLLFGRGRWW